MAHQPRVGGLVVGGDAGVGHPGPHGRGDGRRLRRLEQAVLHVHHVVTPGAVKADAGAVPPGGDGKLHLVAITLGRIGS